MSKDDTINREQFASLALKLMAVYSDEVWNADLAQFALIRQGAGGPKTLALASIYKEYIAASCPDNLLSLQRHLRLLANPVPLPTNRNELLARLLPCLRTLSFFQSSNMRAKAIASPGRHSGELAYFPYADVLAVGLIFDKPETVQHVRHFELDQIGLDADNAIDIAVQNLKQLSMEPMRPVQRGFYTSPWKDSHDGCRLLLTDLFSRLSVQGEVVALPAATDTLFVTGSQDVVGLELMTSLGSALMKSANAVAALPLVLRDGVWQFFHVTAEDPVFDTLNSYRQNILKILYKDQESQLLASQPDSLKHTLTPFLLDHSKDRGFLFSKTCVIDGGTNIMPETDIVEFFKKNWMGKNDCIARTSFAKMAQVLSHRLTRDPNLQPARWFLNAFPSTEELTALGMVPAKQSPAGFLEHT